MTPILPDRTAHALRLESDQNKMTVSRFAGFELDELRAELRCPDGEVIRLRPKLFALLSLLVTNARRIVSKQELMQAVWPNVHVSEDSLFQSIHEVRRALGDDDRKLIRLVATRGYLFEADVARAPAEVAAGGSGAGGAASSAVRQTRTKYQKNFRTSRSVAGYRSQLRACQREEISAASPVSRVLQQPDV